MHRKDEVGGDNVLERARQHNGEQQETGLRRVIPQEHKAGNPQCLLSVHVDDIKGAASKDVADSLLKHLNAKVGQRKEDYNSLFRTGAQHESSPGVVLIHQYDYIGSVTLIDAHSLLGKDEDSLCDVALREAYRSVLGAGAWDVLTKAELAAYVQTLQRRAHAPRIKDCKRLNVVIRCMKKRKCGLKGIALQHPIKNVAVTDVAF